MKSAAQAAEVRGAVALSTIALAGNPNAGKTSLFNLLTGTRQYVGNWPGVTVEKKEGLCKDLPGCRVVDLPGTYSLAALSPEERVAVEYLLYQGPSAVVNVVDASSLERHLYFTAQLLEMGLPVVVVLNMMDTAAARGLTIDVALLEQRLGVPVVPMTARRGIGKDRLIHRLQGGVAPSGFVLPYPRSLAAVVARTEAALVTLPEPLAERRRALAVMALEGNPAVMAALEQALPPAAVATLAGLRKEVAEAGERIRQVRHEWAAQTAREVVRGSGRPPGERTWSDRLDRWLLHPILGIPLFLAILFLLFQVTFSWVGTPLSDALDSAISGPGATGLQAVLGAMGSPGWFTDLMIQGVLGGVGAVLVFIPQIAVLFLGLSFLEDSGYMARAAVLTDRVMQAVGLGGRSFIPMVLGFGCNVPAIMATRTLEDPRARLVTVLAIPFMSCSARLSVYALLVPAFFARHQAEIVFLLYLVGVAAALGTAWLLGRLVGTGDSLFVMELPPYHAPTVRNLTLHTWDKVKGFLRKAGTIIFSVSVLLWFLGRFSFQGPVPVEHSFLAGLGGWIAPLFAPMDFATWQAGVALITGFLAKELVVATMGVAYGAGEAAGGLTALLQGAFTPASALAFLFFILLYTPCLSTVAVMRRETGSWKWTVASVVYSASLAWVVSWGVYHIARWWM
ncbi:ferrous iron transport protein B [Kyrpidia tusciae]|uniref:ferrous iron transport protein B n=1 Tax=Kyrpidia tusciae TaxID=33943 RepID=UPI0002E0B1A3|nr:ferrous iron transport protein B [Kyrpidia tusciae]